MYNGQDNTKDDAIDKHDNDLNPLGETTKVEKSIKVPNIWITPNPQSGSCVAVEVKPYSQRKKQKNSAIKTTEKLGPIFLRFLWQNFSVFSATNIICQFYTSFSF